MYRLIWIGGLALLIGCEAQKTPPPSTTQASRVKTKTERAQPTADHSRPKTEGALAHEVKEPAKDVGLAIATVLMEAMIGRDTKSARSLFPRPEFLNKHFPGEACASFRDKIAANQEGLFPRSRAWVRESIARLLYPKEWKSKMGETTDEIATSLNLRLESVVRVSDTAPSLGDALAGCDGAQQSAKKRYRGTFHAKILGKEGPVTLDCEVINLAQQGWFVVGY